jgi:hypothetical protein
MDAQQASEEEAPSRHRRWLTCMTSASSKRIICPDLPTTLLVVCKPYCCTLHSLLSRSRPRAPVPAHKTPPSQPPSIATESRTAPTMSTTIGSFIAGGIAACGAVTVTHSFETIKIRLQLQGELQTKKEAPKMYKGVIHGIKVVVQNEGVKGLLRGLSCAVSNITVSFD